MISRCALHVVMIASGVPIPAPYASSDLVLAPPYPNPGREEIVFRYSVPHGGPVTVEVYDVRGRLVTELARRSAGDGVERSAVWSTDRVPSGVYFAVLQASGERTSRKVVIEK